MNPLAASAPAKLVLLGEYSVLFGHPAVVMAVNRRAEVGIGPVDGDHWRVEAPGLQEAAAEFDLDGGLGVRWWEPSADAVRRLALVERVIALARERSAAVVRLEVVDDNEPAERLYTRCGFARTGRTRVRDADGALLVEMERRIG